MHRTVGDPASVALDAAWVTEREESKGDVVGFYHTHPSGAPTPSRRDDKTMRARVSSFGKPLACLIEADFQVNAFLYEQGKARGRKLTACDLFPRGAVVMFDPFNKE